IDFYGILARGGFDITIGNPPYVEYSAVSRQYSVKRYDTQNAGNLYAYVIERCYDILRDQGRIGMIVQLPIVCTDRMKPLQDECLTQSKHICFANFDDRPARLFDGLEHIRATIFLAHKGNSEHRSIFSTTYNRWYSECRPQLFGLLSYVEITPHLMDGAIPKIGHTTAKAIMSRINGLAALGMNLTGRSPVYFHNAPQYWIRAMNFAPYFWNEREGEKLSTQVKVLTLQNESNASVAVAALNSSLFYQWFLLLSDCRHLNMREIERFPVGLPHMSEVVKNHLAKLTHELMTSFKRHKSRKECQYKTTGKVVYDEFYPGLSKPIIDAIDTTLAQHYGFTEEELDFIINYDIKYRMGRDNDDDED
ncbi:MAG: Eco57I restriction-modification methylase domain-containing protein, partial [Candidatus Hydrogenedentes bacterium]|nr:Eco57I restriction-modification methylase domain-containing protein [Candidatus Hydrogenedentota bacterium]